MAFLIHRFFSLGQKTLTVPCFFCCTFWLLINCWHSKAMYSFSLSSSFSILSLYSMFKDSKRLKHIFSAVESFFSIFSHANVGCALSKFKYSSVSKNTFGRLCKVFNSRFSDKCTSSQENCVAVKVIGEGML
ncbi:hypothetical protein BX661DRAFT_178613, partial [Kickxella alabastrina]